MSENIPVGIMGRDRVILADKLLKEGNAPEHVAQQLGYKNKESMMACVRTYRNPRGVKSGVVDNDEKPVMPDFIKESQDKMKASQGPIVHEYGPFNHKIAPVVRETAPIVHEIAPIPGIQPQETSSALGYVAPLIDLEAAAGRWIFIPADIRITEMQGMYADYHIDDGEIMAYNQIDHFTKASAAGFASELATVAGLMLPEVSE
jgi:hypothetical protein